MGNPLYKEIPYTRKSLIQGNPLQGEELPYFKTCWSMCYMCWFEHVCC